MFAFRSMQIPEYMVHVIKDYTIWRMEPTSFIKAIICNDLLSAIETADDINTYLIPAYAAYFYNKAPTSCWKSKKRWKHGFHNQRR